MIKPLVLSHLLKKEKLKSAKRLIHTGRRALKKKKSLRRVKGNRCRLLTPLLHVFFFIFFEFFKSEFFKMFCNKKKGFFFFLRIPVKAQRRNVSTGMSFYFFFFCTVFSGVAFQRTKKQREKVVKMTISKYYDMCRNSTIHVVVLRSCLVALRETR